MKSNVCYSVDLCNLSKTIITRSQHSSAWLLKYSPKACTYIPVHCWLVRFEVLPQYKSLFLGSQNRLKTKPQSDTRPSNTIHLSFTQFHATVRKQGMQSLTSAALPRSLFRPLVLCEFTKQENVIWCVDEDRIINRQNDGRAHGL